MNKRSQGTAVEAFTLIELMVTIVIVAVLAMFLLPAILPAHGSKRHYDRINCIRNLKEVGLSFKLWSVDNDDKYPQHYAGNTNYPVVNNPNAGAVGGVGVPWTTADTSCPNMFTIFFAMSNQVSNPRFMACPGDTERTSATNFYSDFALNNIDGKNSKISYFIGKDAGDSCPQMVIAGDRR